MEIFRPERTHLLAAVILTIFALIAVSWAPLKLGWVLIIPALFAWWVLRASTKVGQDGITATYAFRAPKHVTWDDFAGIGFKGAGAFARTNQGIELSLPGVTFNSLPRLSAASQGRIPDALTSARDAAEGKIRVIHRDGYQVLLTQEEYEEYQRTTPPAAE